MSSRTKSLREAIFATASTSELKQKSIRSGAVTLVAQGLKFVLRTGSMMLLGRLLTHEDYGVQQMVVTMTGMLGLFRDVGLSAATVQRAEVTHEQASTLFWVNVAVGVILTLIGAMLAPWLVRFNHEPRVFWAAIVSASAFIFTGLAAQHQALLQRHLKFTALAKIDTASLAIGSVLAIVMAGMDCGYWSLVGMAVATPVVSTLGSWMAMPWLPGWPRRGCDLRRMLHFGGTVTFNGLIVYVAYNTDKFLLGRFRGADALGIYGRAYQVINLPMEQLYSSVNSVAFSTFSRIQDTERLCRSFLKMYSVVLSMTIPVIVGCLVFAEEVVRVVLGPKWTEVVPIFRMLVPTVLVFAMINPFGWFMTATGRAGRSLRIGFMIAPVVMLGVLAGLSRGSEGVALGFSGAMVLLIVPVLAWAMHGTGLTAARYWATTWPVLWCGVVAGVAGLGVKLALAEVLPTIPRLLIGLAIVVGAYASMLLLVMGQKAFYLDVMSQIFNKRRATGAGADGP